MKRLFLLFPTIFLSIGLLSQELKPLTVDDLTKWNRITERAVTDDGKFVAFTTEPWVGDPLVTLHDTRSGMLKESFPCASGISLTSDSRFLVFTISPPLWEIKELKLKKTKKEDMPADMLGIYNIYSGVTDTVRRLKSFMAPSKWSGWIAWQCEPAKDKPAEAVDSTRAVKENGKKQKSQSGENGYTLYIRNLSTGTVDSVGFVTEYGFASEAEFLICSTTGDDDILQPGVMLIDLRKNTRTTIYTGKAKYKQLVTDSKGERAAFLVSFDEKDRTGNTFSLCYWPGKGIATAAATRETAGLPEGWVINENARLVFGDKSQRLFFGTSPASRLKDSTILDEDRPNVDVWHYAEGKLHSAQIIDRQRDMKKAYTAVYHADSKKVVQLGTPEMPDIQLIGTGDGAFALATSNLPYELQSMWEGDPLRYDAWIVDVSTGAARMVRENCRARFRISPEGKYVYWYQSQDSSWYAYDIFGQREYRLTTPSSIACYDELSDVPKAAEHYPIAGWLKDDRALLVSDRYDIWSLDPRAGRPPINITGDGRISKTIYRIIDFDPENEFIDPSVKQYLQGFSETLKTDAYYSLDINKNNLPLKLLGGSLGLNTPLKAKKEPIIIYTKETFEMFPDYYVSDLTFSTEKRLTDANPQQKDYFWGSVELIKWNSLDGLLVEGLLYKPAGFNPSRKYPMIVNFYERSSQELYNHRIPEAHRSTVDYHYYTSNGYLVFVPDIHYRTGYPGQSAFNCVMPGIMSLIDKGFVDEKYIGAQGHSWGGYQVAYLATRTDLFAAIETGAPVVNMFSAYGGIRWETGISRPWQYEHDQSRIGATIWEAPQRYWENSPLFAVDKINTPVLIMSNDLDGHVPWWQGIEFFVAMRRLGKPVWLLNYTGEPHWPLKIPKKVDFQKRMSQFFGHYLKGEPMPAWMKEGIPATEKDFTLGY